MNILNSYFTQAFLFFLLALVGYLGTQVRNLYRKFVNNQIKQDVVKATVLYIEQCFKAIHGPEKLAEAMARASEILAGYGITISETELVAMIEAAVNEFNNSFWRDDTAA